MDAVVSTRQTDIDELLRTLPYKAFIKHRGGYIEDVNQAFADMFGYSKDELLNQNIFDLGILTELSVEIVRKNIKIAEPHTYEIIAKRSNGSVFPVEVIGRNCDGETPPTRVAILRDLTPAKFEQSLLQEDKANAFDSLVRTIGSLAHALETRDPYTSGHQSRVSELSVKIGEKIGLSDFDLAGLELGSLIHDIGKIGIPTSILSKPGKLLKEEFALIKTHPEQGRSIIADLEMPWPILEMVIQHHERIDGSGYPFGLSDKEICIEAKIIAVADTYEAITSHRPYRPSLGYKMALSVINKNAGPLYDKAAVEACTKLIIEDDFEFSDTAKTAKHSA